MRPIDVIAIRGENHGRIELAQGDLTSFAPDERVDAIVVSAFPNDYAPVSGSLIGGLDQKGLSVADLARDKDIDIRDAYSCWLSKPFTAEDPGLGFHRVLGFEPSVRGKPPELVGDIFRALSPILIVRPEIRSIAMPLVAAGDQGYAVATMLKPLLDAAIHWLELGLPLDRILIVVHSDARAAEAADVFRAAKAAYVEPAITAPNPAEYDVFISYAHANAPIAAMLSTALQELRPGIRIFVDHEELNAGAAWQIQIFESLERSRKVVAVLTPDYLTSKACKEEFSIAWIHGNQIGQPLLFPVFALSADLPSYMAYWQYADAREADAPKLREAALHVVEMLDEAQKVG